MILGPGESPYGGTVAVGGLLFVGDPHISSRRPLRRTERDWPGPVLRKLEHLVGVSVERDLLMVLLGDLFDRPRETDEGLKTAVARILRRTRLRPFCVVGNHDADADTLTDGDTLALLAEAGVVDVSPEGGPAARVVVDGTVVGIGTTPHGRPVPHDVRGAFDEWGPVDRTVWCVHHDVALGRPYPGSVPAHAVRGADVVVMGHVHVRTMGVRVGETVWHCPGSLTRTSIDLEHHVPLAHAVDGTLRFRPVPVPHAPDPWNRTGRVVPPAGGGAFVDALLSDGVGDMDRSGDAEGLRALAADRISHDDPPGVARMVHDLLDRAVAADDVPGGGSSSAA